MLVLIIEPQSDYFHVLFSIKSPYSGEFGTEYLFRNVFFSTKSGRKIAKSTHPLKLSAGIESIQLVVHIPV